MGQSSSSLTPEMAAQIKTKVDEIIASHDVVVFSKSHCPYCTMAKKLLEQLEANAFVVELDSLSDGRAIQDYLQELTGQRTVPNIFIKQKHIGGNDSLQALNKRNELKPLL
ncbi:glutaredoxin [Lunasporangiospora selenospora]|uniref:Glutaredoxin n=1 Tax=Lunasporangiospora selenospora TaxID=979761 RepID=A0A9P6FJ26_9FUNG|nr:glutaredoxin [Lunasporangiospora selenospora]